MKIEITCKGFATKPINVLQEFQGNLKTLDEESLNKLKRSILRHGFSFPVFVWGNNLLDGHQRVFATKKLIDEGYSIGDIPVVEIEAKNNTEAGEKVMALNSHYAKMTSDGLLDFLENTDIDIENIADDLELYDIDVSELTEWLDSEHGYNPSTAQDVYQPNILPDISQVGQGVNSTDIGKAEEQLENKYSKLAKKDYVEVICPDCGEEFKIEK